MPQPNKGTHGKPNTAAPIRGASGSKADHTDKVKLGHHPGGTKGTKKKSY